MNQIEKNKRQDRKMKNKKIEKRAEMSQLIKILLWVVFFIIALGGAYFLIKFLTGQ